MFISKPAYYDSFRCIAGACPDSCCKEWAVQVDPDAASFYRSLPGPLGDRLRQVLVEEDGDTILQIENGRCPMWRDDGLCRIQAEQGESALCKTCREFPRLTHDYGDFVERTLELSCPEAARIILSAPTLPWVTEEVPGGEEPEYDPDAMAILKATRQTMLFLLADTSRPVEEVLALALLYGCQAQSELDGSEIAEFDAESAMDTIRQLQKAGDPGQIEEFFQTLEVLSDDWLQRLQHPSPAVWHDGYRNLARYFVERYWLQAVSDYDLYSRMKFAIVSCLLIHRLGGDFLQTAQRYSKEIENNADNVDAILDAMYTCPAFTDDKVLGFLMNH